MIPVYLTTLDFEAYPLHLRNVRARMFHLCRARWQEEQGVSLTVWMPESLGCSVRDFQRERRITAEMQTDGPYYVLADDDCLPVGVECPGQAPVGMAPFLEEAIGILERHPEFAILSLKPTNARIRPWQTRGRYKTWVNDKVEEHASVGGIRVCRTGCLKEWPEKTRQGYDQEHCDALRAGGYRVGYFRKVRMVHLGEGYSTVW